MPWKSYAVKVACEQAWKDAHAEGRLDGTKVYSRYPGIQQGAGCALDWMSNLLGRMDLEGFRDAARRASGLSVSESLRIEAACPGYPGQTLEGLLAVSDSIPVGEPS